MALAEPQNTSFRLGAYLRARGLDGRLARFSALVFGLLGLVAGVATYAVLSVDTVKTNTGQLDITVGQYLYCHRPVIHYCGSFSRLPAPAARARQVLSCTRIWFHCFPLSPLYRLCWWRFSLR